MSVIDRGRGMPVLLGHGFLWNWRMWAPQVCALQERCRLLVPEMWGHGQSGALPAGTRTLADLADQMIELFDLLDIDRAIVVGSSMGGMWGAHLAARAPDRVAGLVIMNSYLGEEPAQQRMAYSAMLNQVAATGEVSPELAGMIIPLFFAPEIERRAPALPAALVDQLARFTPDTLRQSIVPLGRTIFDRPDALSILSQVSAPTLVVAGAEDRARPPAESRIMAETLGCEMAVIPESGHTATLEQPQAVNATLLQFLEQRDWLDRDTAG